MNTNYFWISTAGLAVGTIIVRYSFIAFSNKIEISNRWRELFSFIPAAIFPALILPSVVFHQGDVEWLAGKERLFVLVLALLIAFKFRSMIGTLVFGLVALYVLKQ